MGNEKPRFFWGVILMAGALAAAPARAAGVQKLPNGLRYVVLEDHTSPVVSMQVWVRCGAVDEDDRTAGVSHFLEHMVFKGTRKLSAGEIARVVENRGGALNAATGTEMTDYYIDAPSESFEESFTVLADSVLNPVFPPEEFEKERKVILEEIKRRNDDPQSDLWDAFLENIYHATPYRRQVIGTVQTITAMGRDVLVKQHGDYYVPGNMVVVVAGDVKKSRAVRAIKSHFGAAPKKSAPPKPGLIEAASSGGDVKEITRTAQQAHVAVGFLGPALDDPDQVAMDVLSTVLGGGQSSRLYQTLREKNRSVWNIGSSFLTHAGSGAFGIFAECPPEKARSLPNDIYLLLFDAETNGFSAAELARAKEQIRSSWLFSQETYHGQASQWGFYAVLNRPELMKTYLKNLDRVTTDDLRDLLKVYFRERELSGAILMPKNSADH